MVAPARRLAQALTRRASLAAVCAVVGLGACSADSLEEPEPTVETPGAIVVLDDDNIGLVMFRTRATTGVGIGDPILIVDVLQASPRSFEEARVLARGPDLPVRTPNYFITLRTVLRSRYEVLWFRSLDPS